MPVCKAFECSVACTHLQLAAPSLFFACMFFCWCITWPSAVTHFGMRLHILPCSAWHPLRAACMSLEEEQALVCQRLRAHVPARPVHLNNGML
jgi:hypothetical protein